MSDRAVSTSRRVRNAWSPVSELWREEPLAEGERPLAETRVVRRVPKLGTRTRNLGHMRLTDRRVTLLFNGGTRGNVLTDVPRGAVVAFEHRPPFACLRYRSADGEEEMEVSVADRPRLYTHWWDAAMPLIRGTQPNADREWADLLATWLAGSVS